MDNFLGQRASSSANDDDDALGLLLSDSQISDLDLSSTKAHPESTDAYGFVRSPLTPLKTNQKRPQRPGTPQMQPAPSDHSKSHLSRHRRPIHMYSPYDSPATSNHHRTSRKPAPRNRSQSRSLASDTYSSVSLPPDRFEDDAVPIDHRRLPLHPDESQQDLAERINALTQVIQTNTQFCLDLSGQMLTLASQNKHLLPALSSRVSSVVASYVVEPALKLPGALMTYYPALRDYEGKVRRTLANCANARDMALAQGVGTDIDVKRLKDRLVEQDSLLRDSSSHMQRLIRERDALRQQLSNPLINSGASENDSGTILEGQKHNNNNDGRLQQTASRGDRRGDSAVLADQLRELRIIVDQLALDTASNHDRNDNGSNEEDENDGADSQAGGEEDDWTLL
ncbi:hypothetical protein PG993_005329 [Apiospora rasikravindrae]|uniref:DASH complex subunit SPC19 n=1 Tax=Apiospora rasikravindrae TaxID=990691 RepID=A0ABR1TH93_9PEZI